MRKTIRLFLTCLLAMIMLLSSTVTVTASSFDGKVITPRSSNLITNFYGIVMNDNTDPGNLLISAAVVTLVYCDEVEITEVILQENDGTGWDIAKTWNTMIAYDDYSLSLGDAYTGISGYTYRVLASFRVEDNGEEEIRSCISAECVCY